MHQVVYRADDGNLYELWCVGNAPVSGWSVTGATPGTPRATSDPAAYYSPDNNTQHIIYRSADKQLTQRHRLPYRRRERR